MFKLPDLKYSIDALEPHISKETLEYHYGKHHNAYVTNLNALLEGCSQEERGRTLEEIIKDSSGPIFNNAAQVWNHNFYWECLSPSGGGEPQGELKQKISESFGSFEAFRKQFSDAAIKCFGSGWAWLVKKNDGTLHIESTSNADTPLRSGTHALLTCDVWEHAYYIDYRNARPKYVEAFWSLVNWQFAANRLQL